MIEDFQKWLSIYKTTKEQCLVPDLKKAAFKLISKQKNYHLFKIVAQTYEFVADKDMFIPYLKIMLNEKKYKDTAQYASALCLESHFSDPELLIMPLILQNKNSIVEEFIGNSRDAQQELLIHLDNLLAPTVIMQQFLDEYINRNNIPDVKMSTCQVRPMMKLLSRLVRKFDFPPEVCPNHNRKRGEGALSFLIRKHFIDVNLSQECWREMAREAVGTDPLLHSELVNQVAHYDATEAIYWARTFNVSKTIWPWSVVNIDAETPHELLSINKNNTEENWDEQIQDGIIYHNLCLPRESIIIIDEPQKFSKFLNQSLIGITIVGIDAEWKPCFGVKKTELALIQISTDNFIYIIDVTTLGTHDSNQWKQLSTELFENKNIIKLGFGLNHDIAMLRDSIPVLNCVKFNGHGFLDLNHLWRKLDKDYNFKFPHDGDVNFSSESLSKMVEICLGKRLNKTDQFSNWERRPLREGQIIYAALDAYCLLEVYNVILNLCQERGIPFFDICMELHHISHSSPKKSTKKTVKKPSKSSKNSKIPAHLWRVVCDDELYSLANHLRMCGIDAVCVKFDDIIENNDIYKGRIHLIKKINLDKLSNYRSEYYQLISTTVHDQLKEVLTHFDILVCEENILSRCSMCNQNNFQQISREIMWQLCEKYSNDNNYKNSRQGQQKYYNPADTSTSDNWTPRKALLHPRDNRTWFITTNSHKSSTPLTKFGSRIQFEMISTNSFPSVMQFYVCDNCGNIYWDGSEPEIIIKTVLQNFIVRNSGNEDLTMS